MSEINEQLTKAIADGVLKVSGADALKPTTIGDLVRSMDAKRLGDAIAEGVKNALDAGQSGSTYEPTRADAANRITSEADDPTGRDPAKPHRAPEPGSAAEAAQRTISKWEQMEASANARMSGEQMAPSSSDFYTPDEQRRMMEAEQRAKTSLGKMYGGKFKRSRGLDEAPVQATDGDRFGYRAAVRAKAQDARDQMARAADRQRNIDGYKVRYGVMTEEEANARHSQALDQIDGPEARDGFVQNQKMMSDRLAKIYAASRGIPVADNRRAPSTDGATLTHGDPTSIAQSL